MCGILFSNFQNEPNSTNEFVNALATMNHRGPDATGTWTDEKSVFLGHTRLSIQDLDVRSNQPFLSSDKKHLIIFNGEIYNFNELRKEFNIDTRTTSDTEVLLELYLLLGEKLLEHLNGMFAFVIYNKETKDIFAARDRLGIKPLYVFEDLEKIAFSSEIHALKRIVPKAEFDIFGIRQYLKLRTFFNGNTLYKNIQMFPAGHYFKNGKTTRYWNIEDSSARTEWNDEEIKYLVKDAVRLRRIADVPLGCYLSGGVDSTVISGIAGETHTWTIGFPSQNEFEWGQLAAAAFATTHHEIETDAAEFIDTAKDMIRKRDEPLSVPNEVLIKLMTLNVSKENTVVLSGEGADELFWGYDRIFRWANQGNWNLNEFDSLYSYGSHHDDEVLDSALSPFAHIKSPLDKVASFMQISHLHGLLRRLDNSTMACSVEARVPFVDHRLVEYMYNAPFDFRMADSIVKAPLKRVFKELVPEEILNREKVGFPVPLKEIFSSSNASGMDSWLDFNMEILVGENWAEFKNDLLNDIAKSH